MTTTASPSDHLAREEASDPRFNVSLEASAGTGKTRVLVDRYVRLIAEGARPRNILAITFTRKAAGEMKHRIVDTLRNNRSLWKDVRGQLLEVHIATMDAFCLGLLKEFPLEAGLEPDMDLLENVDSGRLLEEAVEKSLSHRRYDGQPDITFLASLFGDAPLRRGTRNHLRNHVVRGALLDRFVRQRVPRNLNLHDALAEIAHHLHDRLTQNTWTTLPAAIQRAMDAKTARPIDLEYVAAYFLTQTGQPRKKLSRLVSRHDFESRAAYEQHRTQVLEIAPAIAEHYHHWRRQVDLYAVRELSRLYQDAAAHFSRLKRARGGLDFSDVVAHAASLLEQRGAFSQSRFRLESRYHHLLIDEFQDTNDVHWSVIRNLIASWGEGYGLVQEAIATHQEQGRGKGAIQEPSIFVVGDRKQSIYGWRDARVELQQTATDHLLQIRPHFGRKLTIRQSFRTCPSLLEFLNDLFAGTPKTTDDVNWAFRYQKHDYFPILGTDDASNALGLAIAANRNTAAAAVADEIVRLLEEEDYRPQDIAVLFRSRTHYQIYEEALSNRGVPTYAYQGLGFYDSPEVRDLQALIRYLANPMSELRAAEFLRSRFIRLSDTALALIARQRQGKALTGPLVQMLTLGRVNLHQQPYLAPADQAILTHILPMIREWLANVDKVPPSDLLTIILEETDYSACFADRRGAQGWENLKKIRELIRRAQNRGYMTFARLADYLLHASSSDESLAVLEAVDGVSLMTIHTSKGLEFRAVFVVNMDQHLRTDTSLPRITEYADDTLEVHAIEKPDAKGPDRALEEEKRLLYVALTRAKQYLVLSCIETSRETATTLINLLPKSLRDVFQGVAETEDDHATWHPRRRPHEFRILRASPTPKTYQRSSTRRSEILALTPLPAPQVSRTTVSDLSNTSLDDNTAQDWTDSIESMVGTTVHRLFEYAVAMDERLPEIANTLFPHMAGQLVEDRERAIHQIVEFYQQLRTQPELASLLATGNVYSEVLFALSQNGQIVRGSIDTLICFADRVVVVDFKTGSPSETHRVQMELYIEATKGVFPTRSVEGLILYPNKAPTRIA